VTAAIAVLVLLVAAIVVLSSERVPVEITGLVLLVTLVVGGILSPARAFGALASPAVLMIAGVMLLTGSVVHNGAAERIARRIHRWAGSSERWTATLLIVAVNGLSAILNNVAVTALFVPVAEGMADRFGVPRSRYLMPVAFASMTGGMCTLIGTSTNIAVAGAMVDWGLAPLGLFELTPVGVAVAVVGAGYLLVVAPRLLARVPSAAPEAREFLYEVTVGERAEFAGRTLARARLETRLGMRVVAIVRGADRVDAPGGDETVLPGDLMLVQSEARRLPALSQVPGIEVRSMPNAGTPLGRGWRLSEMTVSYNSPWIGRTLKELAFRPTYGASVLAIHRREERIVDKIGRIPLRAGDVLLVYGRDDHFERLGREPSLAIVERLVLPHERPGRALLSTGILVASIVPAAFGWLDSATAFLAGAAVAMATGCLPPRDAGAYLNLRFLVMLASMIALGHAMEDTGAARILADAVLTVAQAGGALGVMACLFVITVALTQPLSNAAAAVLVLPMAIQAALQMGVDPRPFAITVAIAASCSFVTPFEPACLLVYGTGHYRFLDFARTGAGLTLIAGILCLLLVPRFWPLG